jgi:hypothetical protein
MRGISFVLGLCLLSGCGGGSEIPTAPVSGKVTDGGKPVSGVIVRFQPVSEQTSVDADKEVGLGSFGETDENGEFTLRLSDDSGKGAVIGKHTVIIQELTPEEEENDDAGGLDKPPKKSRIPAKWLDGSQRFTVESKGNEANFDLSQ